MLLAIAQLPIVAAALGGLTWSLLDSKIVLTAVLSAMSCALPGVWLVLRRQSMMGDALSHSALLGLVVAFLCSTWLRASGWISGAEQDAVLHLLLFTGAVVAGVGTALLTEWLQQLGRVESSAALGVVFTCLFALGLLLLRLAADNVHIDPDCVLFGLLPLSGLERGIPRAALMNGGMLLLNLALLVVFYKELKVTAFDPALATSQGVNARAMHYVQMAVTAMTAVAAFESVGSILVIALLIIPPATACLLTRRLHTLIGLALLLAALSAVLGHILAKTLPAVIFPRLGFVGVKDADPAGMIAATAGGLFLIAWLLAPHHGLLAHWTGQLRLRLRVVADDVLGQLYRVEEASGVASSAPMAVLPVAGVNRFAAWLAVRRLRSRGMITGSDSGYQLTDSGRRLASSLVRAHRLWETYMHKYFQLPEDHLHATAHRVEHFLDPDLQERLAAELDAPIQDPHGRQIPSQSPAETATPAEQ